MNKLFKDLTKVALISVVSIVGYTIVKPILFPRTDICSDYNDKPISKLDVALVHDMVNDYRVKKRDLINDELKIDDSHSIWFNLETLKKFIYHIEFISKSKRPTINSEENLGIRVYYGNYPERYTWESGGKYEKDLSGFLDGSDTKEYAGLHTLVMIPTIRRGGYNFDFNPEDIDTYNNKLNTIDKYKRFPIINQDITFLPALTFVKGENASSQNHGSLIPPRKPENEEGF